MGHVKFLLTRRICLPSDVSALLFPYQAYGWAATGVHAVMRHRRCQPPAPQRAMDTPRPVDKVTLAVLARAPQPRQEECRKATGPPAHRADQRLQRWLQYAPVRPPSGRVATGGAS